MQLRGFPTLFTREHDLGRYSTGIFVTTGPPQLVATIARHLQTRFPQLALTFLMPQSFCSGVGYSGEVITFETIKKSPLRGILDLRRRRFDLCIVVFSRDPYFRRSRFAALWLKARRVIIYNENSDSYELDRGHWNDFYQQIFGHGRSWRPPTLFFPLGMAYLLGRTWWLLVKARLMRPQRIELKSKDSPKALPS